MSRTEGMHVQLPPRSPLKEIKGLDIAVATARDESGELLIRELQRTHARVSYVWPMPERLPEDVDVIYCDMGPGLSQRIPWVPGDSKAALVLLIGVTPPLDLDLMRNLAPDAVLHRPFTRPQVLTSLTLARAHFNYGRRLLSRVGKLDEMLHGMRNVERAKTILMTKREMREEDAYHYLRRQAMSRRLTISAIATAIIDSHELLG